MAKSKLFVVSNRLPVSVSRQEDGSLAFEHSSGGLATAMSSLDNKEQEQVWIGWPGISSDDLSSNEKSQITKQLKKYNCYPVYLTQMQVDEFYAGYSNDTLWPLFHYFQSLAQYRESYWKSYREVNELFARAVAEQADKKDTIWVHDYHLMLLPAALRKRLPTASIGFFLHIPFPSYEIYRLLPQRKEVLQGLLGADLIGFHIYDYASHFLSSVLRILGINSQYGQLEHDGRLVRIDAFPIGIDYEKFRDTLDTAEVIKEVKALQKHYKNQRIVLSIDRLDYSKGILQRLEAFELLLKENKEFHKNITLLMVAVPSRTEVETYQKLRDQVEQAVGRINGEFGTVDWTPISYQFKNLPFEEVVALYSHADVALVTPLRDGMNLVAKEYIASKKKTDGVLILSEMTGAIDELPEALRINPNSVRSIAKAIKQALIMPKAEQRKRLRTMQDRIASYTVRDWAADFLEQLEAVKETQADRANKVLSSDTRKEIQSAFKQAKSRLILLDYDGTIQGFVSSPDPKQAKPSKKLLELLAAIAAKPHTTLAIVSGRTREALNLWFKDMPISMAAEHGAWIKHAGEWSRAESSFQASKKPVLQTLNYYAKRTAGAFVEEKDYSLVWHYRNVPTQLAYVRSTNLKRELRQMLMNSGIGVYSGNKIVEIKPENIGKGYVASELMALNPADFIMCIGDDYTDEDMFKVLPENAFTLKVGLGETAARHHVSSVDEVIKLLGSLKDA
jgi:trehalose 6-phosphate synthase/phosphatase